MSYRVFTWTNGVDDTNGIDDNITDDIISFVNRKFDTDFITEAEAVCFLENENMLFFEE